ncbi:hypothetical protein, partial [Acidovorax delafieldii]|uniref:hypothetical protein n=2 Tax=Pseudomonadota TaxID=1224 RepID=UPI001ABF7464
MWVYQLIIVVLALALIGQLLAQGGDAFLVLENSRPVGGDREVLTILAWGFATRAGRSRPSMRCNLGCGHRAA